MRKPWSISTTVRNPERLRNFLRVLKSLEDQPFDNENQIRFQTLLIQNKLYKPTNLPSQYLVLFSNPESEITFDVAQEIFDLQNYNDPPMRGRQSANPLNKLGFSIARNNYDVIRITELGNKFLEENYDIGYVFFKSLLKLQFPNPSTRDFTANNGFDIMPLIATMHLIKKSNQATGISGLSKNEFFLFVPTLINHNQIDDYVESIIEYRNSSNKDDFIVEFAKQFYDLDPIPDKKVKNLFDYGDNIMRYFRLTRFFSVSTSSFGGDWRINIEPTRNVETEQLLEMFDGSSNEFTSTELYLNYLSDIRQPILPSEDINNLILIANSLMTDVVNFSTEHDQELTDEELTILTVDFSTITKENLEILIQKIRLIKLSLVEKMKKRDLYDNLEKIEEIIKILQDHRNIRKFSPEQFEKLISDSLKIINDELKIKPNYPVDDNGEPISHAPGGLADIECYYSTFNAICEVTLDCSTTQWIRESQPVMRHLRDFENQNESKPNYCLFIAPRIHEDTLYHFWFSIKNGYNGSKQKIIPLTTIQFAQLLESVLLSIKSGKRYNHYDVAKLYDDIVNASNKCEGHLIWNNQFSSIIEEWQSNLV